MIGNILTVGSYQELQYVMNTKIQYQNSLIASNGNSYVPNKIKIIVVNDDINPGQIPDSIVGSILLPPTIAMYELVDGDYNTFCNLYWQKLDSDPQIQEYIIVLLAGILEKGFDYVFFFNSDSPDMWIPLCKALFTYLYNKFGMIGQYPVTPNGINTNMLFSQGVDPNYVMNDVNLIQQYQVSQNQNGLFVELG